MQTPFLIGSKVYLRPLEREDAPKLGEFINDPEVRHTLEIVFPQNRQQEEAFIERMAQSQNDLVLGIALKDGDKLIGVTGLHAIVWKDRKANFGISIGAKDCWNKGYGTEAARLLMQHAFETLGLQRIALRVFDYNARAIRAYEKVGFQKEGVLRNDVFRAGKFWDVWQMSLLQEDWAESLAAAR